MLILNHSYNWQLAKTFIGVLLVTLLLTACAKKDNSTLIPSRATVAIKVDVKALASKAFTLENLWEMLLKKDPNSKLDSKLDHAAMGIDFTKDAFLYVVPTLDLSGNTSVLVIGLDSDTQFKTFLEKVVNIKEQPTVKDGFQTVNMNNRFNIVWNKDVALIACNTDNKPIEYTDQLVRDAKTSSKESLIEQSKTFRDCLAENGDVCLYSRLSSQNYVGEFTGLLNFEVGKIRLNAKLNTDNPSFDGILSRTTKPELFSQSGIKKPSVALGLAFEPDSLLAFCIANANEEPVVNFEKNLEAYSTNIGEFLQFWDGQIGLVGYVPNQQDGWLMKSQLMVRMGVRDQMLLTEILMRLVNGKLLVRAAENRFTDKLFGITITQADDFVTLAYNTKKEDDSPTNEWAYGHVAGGWIDMVPIFGLASQFYSQAEVLRASNPITSVGLKIDVDDKAFQINSEMLLDDKKRNSVMVLSEYFIKEKL